MHIYLRIEGEIMNQKPTVKEIQEEILILLSELDRVCRKNNIKYSLHGGTLLGAVRESGFIPWDDDADITMMREEHNRLIECFNKESKDFMLIESFLHMPRIVRRKFEEDTVFAWIDIMIYDPITEKNIPPKYTCRYCDDCSNTSCGVSIARKIIGVVTTPATVNIAPAATAIASVVCTAFLTPSRFPAPKN